MARISEAPRNATARVSRAWGGFRWLTPLEDLFMPPVCLHCREKRWGRLPLCRACLRKLAPLRAPVCEVCGMAACADNHADWKFPFASRRFLFPMGPELAALIHGFKYRHLRRHIRLLCSYLRYRPDMAAYVRGFDALVPVPIHPVRRRERGYNQSEGMASDIARLTGIPRADGCLRRVRQTVSQTRLNQEERQRNLEGAFACPDPQAVMGKRLLLVDDVFTTGATVSRCAEMLMKAGCASVGVITLAKVDPVPDTDDFGKELEAVSGYLL